MVSESNPDENHITKSIKQIDSKTWLVGSRILRHLDGPSDSATWHDDHDSTSYELSDADPQHSYNTLPVDTPCIKLIHEAGTQSAVWSIGNNVICKVRKSFHGVTAESDTLEFVRAKHPTFETPKIILHVHDEDRNYLFVEKLPGRTLDAAWPTLDGHWRQHYVAKIADICVEMAQWKGAQFGGVDGKDLPEYYLTKGANPKIFDSAKLQAVCEQLGMNCNDLVFYHADLGPTNIIIEDQPVLGSVALIDFEVGGYFPREWVRTKFRLSRGHDLSCEDDPRRWRMEVQKALGDRGFEDVLEAWKELYDI